jgi:hypothetical protein
MSWDSELNILRPLVFRLLDYYGFSREQSIKMSLRYISFGMVEFRL